MVAGRRCRPAVVRWSTGAWDWGVVMRGRRPSPWGSPEVFRTLLRQAGLTVESLTAASAWSVFGSFSRIEFDVPLEPDSDGLLYQFGIYDFSGEPRFHLDLTRQFGLPDSDEYLQFHCDLQYLPTP